MISTSQKKRKKMGAGYDIGPTFPMSTINGASCYTKFCIVEVCYFCYELKEKNKKIHKLSP